MKHPSADVVAAIRDGGAVARRDRAHVDRCLACRRAAGPNVTPPAPGTRTRAMRLGVLGFAALLVVFAAIAPLRGLAYGFVEIFEPRQLAFVPMSGAELAQLSAMPDIASLGHASTIVSSRAVEVMNEGAAAATAGFPLRLPPAVPGATTVNFNVTSPSIQELVVDEARARASALARHETWVPMPAGMDGSAVRIAFGSMVVAHYTSGVTMGGTTFFGMHPAMRRGARLRPSAQTPGTMRRLDDLAIFETAVPKVGSTGASLATIERYLIDRPGMPQRLVNAIESLRDPSTTLPIPLPMDQKYATPVVVDGVWGTALGDQTGLGAAVIWTRDGMIYGVAGQRTESDVLAIANDLR